MESFDGLITKYESFIKNKSRYYGRDFSEADELRQKASIVLWQNYYKLIKMNEQSVKAFLSTAIKNALIDLRRREKKIISYDVLENQLLSEGEDWEGNLVNNIHILSVIYKLSTEEQDIVFKAYFMRMNSVEIGKQLNIPPSTVRSKLMRANQKLKKLLSENE